MHGLGSQARSRYLQGAGASTNGRVIRYGEIKAEHAEDRADQSLGLAQRQAEPGPQRQRGQDRQRRVVRLPARASYGAWHAKPQLPRR
jgi:hypothetical protein